MTAAGANPPPEIQDAQSVPWTAFDRIYDPTPTPLSTQLGEIWAYRELLGFLVWRALRVRYRQTVLGATWVLLQPATITVLFTLFFGRMGGMAARLPDGAPYPLFVYAGLVPYALFTGGYGRAAGSLVGHGYLISRIWFPRLLLPLEAVLIGLADSLVSCLLLVAIMIWFGQAPALTVVLSPLFLVLALAAALGLGLCLGALVVYLRDLRQALPFLGTVVLFVTPLAWPTELLSSPMSTLVALNPLVGAVEGFRWALYGAPLDLARLGLSTGVTVLVLGLGLFLFRRVERNAADLV